jgi:uncharacterized protein YbdZ (MbtH family)
MGILFIVVLNVQKSYEANKKKDALPTNWLVAGKAKHRFQIQPKLLLEHPE